MDKIETLKAFYNNKSKHSNYQVLSQRLHKIIGSTLRIESRNEIARLNYIVDNIDLADKDIVDIGGNTGFFTFELLDKGAKHLSYYEGNEEHAKFVELAASVLNAEQRISVNNKYFNFSNELANKLVDITLLLNVLHHIGDDYGDKSKSKEAAKSEIIKQLNSLSPFSKSMVFQLGFNWKGDRNSGLFENGTKKELIDFIEEGIKDHWTIKKTGIASKINDQIVYNDLDDSNIKRDDSLGEFLNRPLFILESLKA